MIYAVLSRGKFSRKFTQFCMKNCQAIKWASVNNMTNMRYASPSSPSDPWYCLIFYLRFDFRFHPRSSQSVTSSKFKIHRPMILAKKIISMSISRTSPQAKRHKLSLLWTSLTISLLLNSRYQNHSYKMSNLLHKAKLPNQILPQEMHLHRNKLSTGVQ